MRIQSDGTEAPAVRVCRFCGADLRKTFVDLGMSPLCETYPSAAELERGEVYYPLHVYVCEQCFLVQLQQFEPPEKIFSEYPYFSSYSDSWLQHCENYCRTMAVRFGLNRESFVVEVASNDGYLLQYFVREKMPVLGIEPAGNVARAAVEKGVPTLVEFFGTRLAKQLAAEGRCADLVIANNVLAQVPDLNDFVKGLSILLKSEGVLTLEFPHLLKLIELNEFDTIYHEHFSYFSMLTAVRVLQTHGMRVFDVEELKSHGGSLRVYACREENLRLAVSKSVRNLVEREQQAGLAAAEGYEHFAAQVRETKWALVEFLLTAARQRKKVAGYGAPGKSATLLQYCGIQRDLIEYTVDRSPHKQGRFLPGSHIPIYHPDRIRESKPDFVVILPWNLKDEIMTQLQFIREWGGRFVVPIPRVTIC
ncbi:MAG: methyltransferase domain-containing protein [Acidobacteria bacterium]|nr:methyltransferase domain-containing protein [Acidobacteriota bacterium]MBV9623092.1 methyltransferase domain-containing protein [Acidobacteriota bacterium]